MKILLILSTTVLIGTSAAATAADPPPARSGMEPGDKMICKRFVRIGTLAGVTRTCKTRREWDNERAAIRQPTSGGSGYCGPRETGGGMSTETC